MGRCMEMEELNQYREDLLAWCNNIYFHWESIKPRFSKFLDIESLEKWEGSCRQLKEKLQAEVDFDNYQKAKSLYEQWEQLIREAHADQEDFSVKSDNDREVEEQKQNREALLEWSNNIHFHWESMKPRFSKLFDLKSLEEWEESFRELKEKLEADVKVDFDDYHAAKSLYEQWEQLFKEAHAYQEEIEV